jgi:hypothetical protein
MRFSKSGTFAALLFLIFSQNSLAFTIKISGEGGALGEKAQSGNCKALNEEAFTVDANDTVYTSEKVYSGYRAIKMTVKEGSTGFGSFGGSIEFRNCEHVEGSDLIKGDQIWIRTRMYFPNDFEFNSGRTKFMRLRTYNTIDGITASDGYNDLYINGHPEDVDFKPFWFIYEGEQNWYNVGTIDDYFEFGKWKTVELYLKLDSKKESEGGAARVRIWVDGKLIGDTGERRTLKTETSFMTYFSLFTWYGNEGSPKTQSLYLDDLFITTDTPADKDENGNSFIGMGDPKIVSAPNSPVNIKIE